MKIVLISEYNIYTTIGGTETYLDMLLKGLVNAGHEVVLITQGRQPLKAGIEKKIVDGGTTYFLPKREYTKAEIRQSVISSTCPEFKNILTLSKPDIVHVHTFSTFFNFNHLLLCRQAGYSTIFTTHVPGHFCSKGDLIQNSEKLCNGKVGTKCIRCLFSKGIGIGISGILNGYYLKPLKLLNLLQESSIHLVCVSDWQKKHAILNGFPNNQISVIRQAISLNVTPPVQKQNEAPGVLRVGYLGRFSPEKGSAFLLQLMEKMQDDINIQFVIGVPLGNSDKTEVAKLKALEIKMRGKIEILDNINSSNKEFYFSKIDCLLIPSFFWETGPIVLLESISYAKPVLAVNIGGTAEYAIEFPEMVKTYEWGNISDAKKQLDSLKHIRIDHTVYLNSFLKLKEKERQFVQQHVAIYEKVQK